MKWYPLAHLSAVTMSCFCAELQALQLLFPNSASGIARALPPFLLFIFKFPDSRTLYVYSYIYVRVYVYSYSICLLYMSDSMCFPDSRTLGLYGGYLTVGVPFWVLVNSLNGLWCLHTSNLPFNIFGANYTNSSIFYLLSSTLHTTYIF